MATALKTEYLCFGHSTENYLVGSRPPKTKNRVLKLEVPYKHLCTSRCRTACMVQNLAWCIVCCMITSGNMRKIVLPKIQRMLILSEYLEQPPQAKFMQYLEAF